MSNYGSPDLGPGGNDGYSGGRRGAATDYGPGDVIDTTATDISADTSTWGASVQAMARPTDDVNRRLLMIRRMAPSLVLTNMAMAMQLAQASTADDVMLQQLEQTMGSSVTAQEAQAMSHLDQEARTRAWDSLSEERQNAYKALGFDFTPSTHQFGSGLGQVFHYAQRALTAPARNILETGKGAVEAMNMSQRFVQHAYRWGKELETGPGFKGAWSRTANGERYFAPHAIQAATDALGGDTVSLSIAQDMSSGRTIEDILDDRGVVPGSAGYTAQYRQLLDLSSSTEFLNAMDELRYGHVSFGRTIANSLGIDPRSNKWAYTLASGSSDALMDLVLDPLLIAGKARHGIRLAKYAYEAADGVEVGVKLGRWGLAGQRLKELDELAKAGQADRIAALKAGDTLSYNRQLGSMGGVFRNRVNPVQRYMTMVADHMAAAEQDPTVLRHLGHMDPRMNKVLVPLLEYDSYLRGERFLARYGTDAERTIGGISSPSDMARFISDGDGAVELSSGRWLTRGGEMPTLTRGKQAALTAKIGATNIINFGAEGFSTAAMRPVFLEHLDPAGTIKAAEEALAKGSTYSKEIKELTPQLGAVQRLVSKPFQVVRAFTQLKPGSSVLQLMGEHTATDIERFLAMAWSDPQRAGLMGQYFQAGSGAARIDILKAATVELMAKVGAMDTPAGMEAMRRFATNDLQQYAPEGLDKMWRLVGERSVGILPEADTAWGAAVPDAKDLHTLAGQANRLSMQHLLFGSVPAAWADAFLGVWRPAVLLRLGFIPRAAGDEALSAMARLGAWSMPSRWAGSIGNQPNSVLLAPFRAMGDMVRAGIDEATLHEIDNRLLSDGHRARLMLAHWIEGAGRVVTPAVRASARGAQAAMVTAHEIGRMHAAYGLGRKYGGGAWFIDSPIDNLSKALTTARTSSAGASLAKMYARVGADMSDAEVADRIRMAGLLVADPTTNRALAEGMAQSWGKVSSMNAGLVGRDEPILEVAEREPNTEPLAYQVLGSEFAPYESGDILYKPVMLHQTGRIRQSRVAMAGLETAALYVNPSDATKVAQVLGGDGYKTAERVRRAMNELGPGRYAVTAYYDSLDDAMKGGDALKKSAALGVIRGSNLPPEQIRLLTDMVENMGALGAGPASMLLVDVGRAERHLATQADLVRAAERLDAHTAERLGDVPGESRDRFILRYNELQRRTMAAEKLGYYGEYSDEEVAALHSGDWRRFSELRGYTEAEMADYEQFLAMHGDLTDAEMADIMTTVPYPAGSPNFGWEGQTADAGALYDLRAARGDLIRSDIDEGARLARQVAERRRGLSLSERLQAGDESALEEARQLATYNRLAAPDMAEHRAAMERNAATADRREPLPPVAEHQARLHGVMSDPASVRQLLDADRAQVLGAITDPEMVPMVDAALRNYGRQPLMGPEGFAAARQGPPADLTGAQLADAIAEARAQGAVMPSVTQTMTSTEAVAQAAQAAVQQLGPEYFAALRNSTSGPGYVPAATLVTENDALAQRLSDAIGEAMLSAGIRPTIEPFVGQVDVPRRSLATHSTLLSQPLGVYISDPAPLLGMESRLTDVTQSDVWNDWVKHIDATTKSRYTSAVDNRVMHEVLRPLMDGEWSMRHLTKINSTELPSRIWGPKYAVHKEGLWSKAVRWGFDKVLGPGIDAMVREPLFAEHYMRALSAHRGIERRFVDAGLEARAARVLDRHGLDPEAVRGLFHDVGVTQPTLIRGNRYTGAQAPIGSLRDALPEELAGLADDELARLHHDWLTGTLGGPKPPTEADAIRVLNAQGFPLDDAEVAAQLEILMREHIAATEHLPGALPHVAPELAATFDRLPPEFHVDLQEDLSDVGNLRHHLSYQAATERRVAHGLMPARTEMSAGMVDERVAAIKANAGRAGTDWVDRQLQSLADDMGISMAELHAGDYNLADMKRPEVVYEATHGPDLAGLTDAELGTLRAWHNNMDAAEGLVHNAAMDNAVNNMLPFIDDHHVRSQASDWLRHVSPFLFAQEQFLKRWARTFAHSPEAIYQAQLLMHGLRSSGLVQKDQYGNDVYVYPGSAAMTNVLGRSIELVTGSKYTVPMAVPLTGAVQYSLPGLGNGILPGTSPIVAVALGGLRRRFPEFNGLEQAVQGERAAGQGVFDMLVPSSVRTMYRFMAFNPEKDQQLGSAMIQTMSAMAAKDREYNRSKRESLGLDPTDPDTDRPEYHLDPALADTATSHDREVYLERMSNYTRIMLLTRGILGYGVPATPTPLYRGDVHEYLIRLLKAMPDDPGAAFAEFMKQYPDADAYTVFGTQSPSGAPLPSSPAVGQWLSDNAAFVDRHKLAGSWMLPPSDSDDPTNRLVYNQLMARGLRVKKAPAEWYDDWKFAEAAPAYFDSKKAHDQKLERLAYNPAARRRENLGWQQWKDEYFTAHPLFADQLNSGEAAQRRTAVLRDFREAVYDPQLPQSPHIDNLVTLVDTYDRYTDQLALLSTRRDQAANLRRRRLQRVFGTWAEQFLADNPDASGFYNRNLRPDLADEVTDITNPPQEVSV